MAETKDYFTSLFSNQVAPDLRLLRTPLGLQLNLYLHIQIVNCLQSTRQQYYTFQDNSKVHIHNTQHRHNNTQYRNMSTYCVQFYKSDSILITYCQFIIIIIIISVPTVPMMTFVN